MKNYKYKKTNFFVMILLSIFLIISGGFFINKYVFSSAEDDLAAVETNVKDNGTEVLLEKQGTEPIEYSNTDGLNTYTPVSEIPISENPVSEPIITENPVSEPIITENPVFDSVITENPVNETPVNDTSVIDKALIDNHISEDPELEPSVTGITVSDAPVDKSPATEAVKQEKLIVQTDADYHVIPDKYNTGCSGKLEKVTGTFFAGEIELRESGGKITFDFFYRNKNASGTYVIENYDFSNFGLAFNSEGKVSGKKINIVFNNCKFSTINTMRPSSDVFAYTFNDCTIRQFLGSNSTFNRCKFGDSYSDCIIPFNNIIVNDCYFSNLASNDPAGNGKHSDGTQMYGYSDAMVQNVLFSNCRFEIPAVKTTQSTAAVNACVTLGLEYNNAKNVKVENCILNGGGYTIYATKKYDHLSMTEVYFTNIKVGDAKLFGSIYPSVAENVTFKNVADQDSLYVSSVWYDGGKTHVIVSNDTSKERILRVVTGTTSKEYTIKACLGGSALRYDNFDMSFDEFPFDIDISIDAKKDYVLCFDVTDGIEKQIRYVSFDNKPTYYAVDENTEPILNGASGMYLTEGKCGNDITYTLDKEGTLKIEGKGAIFDYDSKKPAPWSEYATSVVNVELSEGITHIGTQAFRKMINIQSIKLPKTLTKIGSNAFIGCGGLKYLTFYSGVTNIGKYAFNGTKLIKCNYYGSEDEWNSITIEANNNPLLNCERIYESN